MNEAPKPMDDNDVPIDRIRDWMGDDVNQLSKGLTQWRAGNHAWFPDAARLNNHFMKTVFVVDSSREFRSTLSRVLTAGGYYARLFESAEQFLAIRHAETPACLLAEIVLPGMSGLELQHSLARLSWAPPIVFLTGNCDILTSVRAMKAGAVDFLTKPVDDDRLISALKQAIRRGTEQRLECATRAMIQQRFNTLTRRERQVMTHIISGRLNKQIAADLGSGEKTVKVHRGRVMSKMGVRSVAELVQLGARIGVTMEAPLLKSNWEP